MKLIRFITKLLVIIGALNWGLVGFFHYDLVADLFGGMESTSARIVYDLIGIAGLVFLWCWVRHCCRGSCCKCGNGNCKCGPNCHCCSDKNKDCR